MMSAKQSAYDENRLTAKRRVPQAQAQRPVSLAAQDLPTVTAQQARIDPRSLSSHQVLQLQRAIGNQAVSALLVRRQQNHQTPTASDTMVQMDEVLPGRKKRRRKEQQAELAAMDAENAEWERSRDVDEADSYVNPFAALAGLEDKPAPEDMTEDASSQEEDVVEQAKTPPPTIAELRSAGKKSPKAITELLVSTGYSPELASQMSRTLRSKPTGINSIQDLERAARTKLAEQEEEPSSPLMGGSRTLNTRGGAVSNLKKGIGAGWKAGDGSTWHCHYDHVKFGKDSKTRVDFYGRSQADILVRLAEKSQGKPTTNLDVCRKWIRENIK